MLKSSKRVVFILDGLDELPLERFPEAGIVVANRLLEWPNAKVIITSRIDFLALLETKFGNTTYMQHLTQGQMGVEEIFLMPFNDAQMQSYIERYSATPDADWSEASRYTRAISLIHGLKDLARIPFMLKLLLTVLPRLVVVARAVTLAKVEVYEAFIQNYFERETWKDVTRGEVPMNEDRPARLGELGEVLGQALFVAATTRAKVRLVEDDLKLLRGLPGQQFEDGSFSFVHKSMQEYFAARAWMRAISGSEEERLNVLGARLATAEMGMLGFVQESYRVDAHFEPLLAQVLSSREIKYTSSSSPSSTALPPAYTPARSSSSIASANAMTILVATRSNLSTMDLSGISAPGANLEGIIADGANLSEANLEGASLRKAWIRNADLRRANLTELQLGQHFEIHTTKMIRYMGIYQNKILVVESHGGGASLWDMEKGECEEALFIDPKLRGKRVVARGDVIICIDEEDSIHICRAPSKTFAAWPEVRQHGIIDLITVHHGRVITTYKNNQDIAIAWDLATGRQSLPPLQHIGEIVSIAGSEGRVATADANTINIWDLMTGELIISQVMKAKRISICGIKALVFTNDNSFIWHWSVNQIERIDLGSFNTLLLTQEKVIIGGGDGSIQVLDLTSRQQIGDRIAAHTGPIGYLALWNNKIISASFYEVCQWDLPQAGFAATRGISAVSAGGTKFALKYHDNIEVWETQVTHPSYSTPLSLVLNSL